MDFIMSVSPVTQARSKELGDSYRKMLVYKEDIKTTGNEGTLMDSLYVGTDVM